MNIIAIGGGERKLALRFAAEAIRAGKVHSGTSAGALLPFELAHSCVAKKPAEEDWEYEYLHPLGVIPGAATAHADQHDPTRHGYRPLSRLDDFAATLPNTVKTGYAIDNNAAAVFSTGSPRIIRAKDGADVHMLKRREGGVEIRIAEESDLQL